MEEDTYLEAAMGQPWPLDAKTPMASMASASPCLKFCGTPGASEAAKEEMPL